MLQNLIQNLAKGETTIASNVVLRVVYGFELKITGHEWAEKIRSGRLHFWLDYVSMVRLPLIFVTFVRTFVVREI